MAVDDVDDVVNDIGFGGRIGFCDDGLVDDFDGGFTTTEIDVETVDSTV